jgi:hypothetical protein
VQEAEREREGERELRTETRPPMAALQDSAWSKDHGAEPTDGGGEPKRKRARSVGVVAGGGGAAAASADVRKENGFSAPVAAPESPPAPASPARSKSAAGSVVDVTVVDADVLDCGVCFLPLKPPIFQVLYTTAATNSSQTTIFGDPPSKVDYGKISCSSKLPTQ